MRRVMDLLMVVMLLTTAVVTYRAFMAQESPKPATRPEPPLPDPNWKPSTQADLELKKEIEEQKAAIRRSNEWDARRKREAAEMAAEDRKRWEEAERQRSQRGQPTEEPWYEKPLLPDDWGRASKIETPSVTSEFAEPRSEMKSEELEVKRREAYRKLDSMLGSLSGKARSLVSDVQSYERSCRGTIPDALCDSTLESIGRKAIVVARELSAAQTLSRTSWIRPGEMRELRDRHGLGDAVWDQLITIVNVYAR